MSSSGDLVGKLIKDLKTSDRPIRVTWLFSNTTLTISLVGKLDALSSENIVWVKGNAPGDSAQLSLDGKDIKKVWKPSGVLLQIELAGGGQIRLTEA